jgi:uncharacterized protein YqeY
MRERLRQDLKAALKNRDAVAVSALRSAIAAIDNAEAVDAGALQTGARDSSEHVAGAAAGVGAADVPRRTVGPAEVRSLVQGEVDGRLQAARDYEERAHPDRAERLRREAEVLSAYLS